MPADIDGPHNVTVSPDGRFWYVSIAHGTPYGSLWKMAADGDTLVRQAPLEMFPTTIALTPDGELAFVANSRSEEHTSELQSQSNLVCRLLLEKKKKTIRPTCGIRERSQPR